MSEFNSTEQVATSSGIVLTLKGETYCEANRQWSVNGVPMPEGVTPAEWRAKTCERIEYHLDCAKALIDALDFIARDPDLEPEEDACITDLPHDRDYMGA